MRVVVCNTSLIIIIVHDVLYDKTSEEKPREKKAGRTSHRVGIFFALRTR